jgi:hypothetical protein
MQDASGWQSNGLEWDKTVTTQRLMRTGISGLVWLCDVAVHVSNNTESTGNIQRGMRKAQSQEMTTSWVRGVLGKRQTCVLAFGGLNLRMQTTYQASSGQQHKITVQKKSGVRLGHLAPIIQQFPGTSALACMQGFGKG